MTKVLTQQETGDFCQRIAPSLELMNAVGFADMKIEAPGIGLFPDEEMFFDPRSNTIHLGFLGILKVFRPETEQELFSAINYVRGHEEQHRRSTATGPYAFAIQAGKKAVLEYIQEKVDGYKKKFRKDAEYEIYANSLPSKGIHIHWSQIDSFVASLANALEDGRIERLRSNRFPGFANLRMLFRGKFWYSHEGNYKPYADIAGNAVEKLDIIFSQILSLATCNLYSKGFDTYEGTPLETEVNAFMPDIASAVMSGKTRGLIDPVTHISAKLAPYLFDACQMSEQDVQMQQMMADFFKKILAQMLDAQPQGDLSERDEDTDDGSANSAMPMSDLVITLDDDTFDKLMEQQKQNGSNSGSGGIMVKREHPKEEDESGEDGEQEKDSSESDSETGQGDGKGEKNQSGKDGESANGQGDGENSESGDTGKQSSSQASDGSNSADSKSNKNSDNSKQKSSSASNSAGTAKNASMTENRSEQEGQSEGKEQAAKHVSKAEKQSVAEQVKEAMKAAAQTATAEADVNITSANVLNAKCRTSTVSKKETIDTSKPISPAEMKDICDFSELKREYQVKDNLPAVYAQRGKTLHRKNEMYFKSLSTPNVSYLDSGSIDPSRIYGLAMGDTEVFRKKGKDKKFDGCAYILVDNSGSMYGKKREEACKAAAVIEEGFKGLLPFKIVAFDECGTVIHEVIKNWDESLNKNCCWNFFRYGRSGCGNEDGYDVQIATRELLARPERKKMLIVLSDGTPGNPGYCRQAIDYARKQGISVHGIYFEEGECRSNPQFASMYQKDYICCPLNELDANLQKIMKKFSRS